MEAPFPGQVIDHEHGGGFGAGRGHAPAGHEPGDLQGDIRGRMRRGGARPATGGGAHPIVVAEEPCLHLAVEAQSARQAGVAGPGRCEPRTDNGTRTGDSCHKHGHRCARGDETGFWVQVVVNEHDNHIG